MALLEQPPSRPPGAGLRRAAALLVSAGLHGSVLGWVALGSPFREERPKSLYEQVIKPNRNRIVWYHLQKRLPDISPVEKTADARPPRAEVKLDQTIVSKADGAKKASQMIWLPEPEVPTVTELPSPNVVAVAPQARPVRAFTAPPERAPEVRPAALPEAPEVVTAQLRAAPVAAAVARPQPRLFTPPPERPREARPAVLPAAPELTMALNMSNAPMVTPALPVKPAPRTFVPPLDSGLGRALPESTLPAAPEIRAARMDVALPAGLPQPARPVPRAFVPPSADVKALGKNSVPTLPAAPEVRAATMGAPLPQGLPQAAAKPAPRAFVPPPGGVHGGNAAGGASLPSAPELRAGISNQPSAAIVGLHPAATTEIPRPEGSRRADFAAGPDLRREGGAGSGNGNSLLSVPGLLVRGAASHSEPALVARVLEPPTSSHNLMAAARANPPATPTETEPRHEEPRVSPAPDPRLQGRTVYSIAVQMPNVTSYTGSWILWFAEREPVPGGQPQMRPPLPLHKVDPKYIQAAAEDRVEGKVRLAAVIRKSGRVEAVALLRGLDERLDRSAVEAMGKWEFEPAARNGVPVDVDAVVEIPFRLAPKTSKSK
jgi:TonB family protein